MSVILPERFQDQLVNGPEVSYGVNRITVILKNGKRFDNVLIAWGREVVKVGGSLEIPFSADEIQMIEIKIE